MTLITETDYAPLLDSSDLKGLLPFARELALSRPESHIATADVFCAIVLQDQELLDKLTDRYRIDENRLRSALKLTMPAEYKPLPVDEFEELQITPRLDNAFRKTSEQAIAIERRTLLRNILRDDQDGQVSHLLMDLAVIPVCYIGSSRTSAEDRKFAMRKFEEFLLGKDGTFFDFDER